MTHEGATLALAACLVRAAAGLDDHEPISLELGAEDVRQLALAAKKEVAEKSLSRIKFRKERDEARSVARRLLAELRYYEGDHSEDLIQAVESWPEG